MVGKPKSRARQRVTTRVVIQFSRHRWQALDVLAERCGHDSAPAFVRVLLESITEAEYAAIKARYAEREFLRARSAEDVERRLACCDD